MDLSLKFNYEDMANNSESPTQYSSLMSMADEHLSKYNINVFGNENDPDHSSVTLFIPKLRINPEEDAENLPCADGEFITCEITDVPYFDETDSMSNNTSKIISDVMPKQSPLSSFEFSNMPTEYCSKTSSPDSPVTEEITFTPLIGRKDDHLAFCPDVDNGAVILNEDSGHLVHSEPSGPHVIDLSKALLNLDLNESVILSPSDPVVPSEDIVLVRASEIMAAVPRLPCLFTTPGFIERRTKRRAKCSPFGKVMCVKFKEREIPVIPHKYYDTCGNITPFKFDTPSPDEINLARLKKKKLPLSFLEQFNRL